LLDRLVHDSWFSSQAVVSDALPVELLGVDVAWVHNVGIQDGRVRQHVRLGTVVHRHHLVLGLWVGGLSVWHKHVLVQVIEHV